MYFMYLQLCFTFVCMLHKQLRFMQIECNFDRLTGEEPPIGLLFSTFEREIANNLHKLNESNKYIITFKHQHTNRITKVL